MILFTVALMALNSSSSIMDKYPDIHLYALLLFFILEGLTILLYLYLIWILPAFILFYTRANPSIFWRISRDPRRVNRYVITEPLFYSLFSRGRKKGFVYQGQVDGIGRPHGYGKFSCEWRDGEVLQGVFDSGIPIGPFISREVQSGYSFQNLRIGFFTCSSSFYAKSAQFTTLQYGVAAVEVSVSGQFFNDLPKSSMIGLLHDVNLHDVNNNQYNIPFQGELVHISQFQHKDLCGSGSGRNESTTITSQVTILCSSRGIHIPGYTLESPTTTTSQSDGGGRQQVQIEWSLDRATTPTLLLSSPWIKQPHVNEAIIFIPGFNISVEKSVQCFGQMLGLTNLPSHIKPVCFQWPGGGFIQYGRAIGIANSKQVRDAFRDMCVELERCGVSKIHVLAHSMAARVLVNVADDFKDMFYPASAVSSLSKETTSASVGDGGGEGKRKRLELSSITLLNPETPLHDFRAVQFDQLRSYCSLITIYGNRDDLALYLAEAYCWTPMLGRHLESLNRHSALDLDGFAGLQGGQETSGSLFLLDVDVIDTTSLDNNVRLDRHSYFSVNKYVVDDIMDIVISQKRASGREYRLVSVGSNVYSILSAPSFVVQS